MSFVLIRRGLDDEATRTITEHQGPSTREHVTTAQYSPSTQPLGYSDGGAVVVYDDIHQCRAQHSSSLRRRLGMPLLTANFLPVSGHTRAPSSR